LDIRRPRFASADNGQTAPDSAFSIHMVEGRADSLAVVGSAARPDAATLWRLYVDEGLAVDSLVHRFSGPGALFRLYLPFVEP
jgi:hypothetical protein